MKLRIYSAAIRTMDEITVIRLPSGKLAVVAGRIGDKIAVRLVNKIGKQMGCEVEGDTVVEVIRYPMGLAIDYLRERKRQERGEL